MSHYTTVKTKIQAQHLLISALEALELPYEIADEGKRLKLNGWMNSSEAEVVVRRGRLNHAGYRVNADLGFRLTDTGEYEVLMDDYDLDKFGMREQLLNPLLQQYSVALALEWAAEQGFEAQVSMQENGEIEIVTTSW